MKKQVVNSILWVLSIALVVVLLGFAEANNKRLLLEEFRIHVDNGQGNFFITQKELEEELVNMGYIPGTMALEAIDTRELEAYFDRHPSIKKSEVYTSLNGDLMVEVRQRKPIIRVYTASGESYYLDADGNLMPLSKNYTSRTLVANGAIHAPYHLNYKQPLTDKGKSAQHGRNALFQLYKTAITIQSDPFWKAQFAQVFVKPNGEFELIPKVGNHTVLIGRPHELEAKLNKLKLFYEEGLNKTGWNEYTAINLKFKNQVVCTKK